MLNSKRLNQQLFKRGSLFGLILCLILPMTAVHAQDTPENIREPAIADLQARLSTTARPAEWRHELITVTDGNLGCPILPAGNPFPTQTEAYVVYITYDTTVYRYHVSLDAQTVIPCFDQSLIFSQTAPAEGEAVPLGQPNPGYVSETCPATFADTQWLPPRLSIGSIGRVEAGGVPNNVRASYGVSSDLVGEIPQLETFLVLQGPECTGDGLVWWEVGNNNIQGWTVESLNSEYALEPINATAPAANPAGANNAAAPNAVANNPLANSTNTNTPIDPAELNGAALPDATARLPIGAANAPQIGEFGNILFPDSIVNMDAGANGTLSVYIRGMALKDNVLLYENIATPNLVFNREFTLRPGVNYIGTSPSGNLIVTGVENAQNNKQIMLWNAATNAQLAALPELTGDVFIYLAAVSPDDNFVAYYYTQNGQPKANIYNRQTNTNTDLALSNPLSDLAFSPDNTRLATLDSAGTLDIWTTNPVAGQIRLLTNVTGDPKVVFAPDGNRVAVGGGTQVAKIYDLTSQSQVGTDLQIFFDVTTESRISGLAFSNDGTLLAVGGYVLPMADNADNSIALFDVASSQQVATLIGHEKVMGIEFMPDGTTMISHGEYTVRLWGIEQQQ